MAQTEMLGPNGLTQTALQQKGQIYSDLTFNHSSFVQDMVRTESQPQLRTTNAFWRHQLVSTSNVGQNTITLQVANGKKQSFSHKIIIVLLPKNAR